MRSPSKPGGSSSSLGSLLIACAATLFIASRLWVSSRDVVHLVSCAAAAAAGERAELAATQALAAQAAAAAAAARLSDSSPAGAEGSNPALPAGGGGGEGEEGQPLLFYSVRSQHPLGSEAAELAGPRLEEDPLPLGVDPEGRLLGQVNSVEAGRVHGWACVRGSLAADLAVTVYVDGVRVGQSAATLPTQAQPVRQLCQLDATSAAAAAQQQAALAVPGGGGVGFVVPLPPLPQGLHVGLTSRARRDMLRKTWVPSGRLGELERELGVRIRFFVGYSQQRGDAVEAELAEEARQHGDMERLAVQDEYGELSRKTARLFSQMSSTVHADFYFKIDDDVAVNVQALSDYLRERRQQGNLYLGCMKSGEVLTDKRWKWYEPEFWRFGDPAGKENKVNYMRHASGQIYGMSRPVARYIAQNEAILHRYANEDVAVGAWLVGLDIVYDNQRRLCCDTEWKCTQQNNKDNVCLAFSENHARAWKKGKLPWWGQSGWAASSKAQGSTADLKDGKEGEKQEEAGGGAAGDKKEEAGAGGAAGGAAQGAGAAAAAAGSKAAGGSAAGGAGHGAGTAGAAAAGTGAAGGAAQVAAGTAGAANTAQGAGGAAAAANRAAAIGQATRIGGNGGAAAGGATTGGAAGGKTA
ncbi:hypothetical protein CHLNCDRAFT_133227 [Chlorella variabilis]|uniref:Galectin domain-containing protein n=1 Tax=Chlorella variabilis TaxID=554065 RepID=E1Z2M9_CHLVA|nr:hypothetical protein CHLNCDRAFT_133227 [Chlorella variabilis]EFN59688.1 hypothetical protein CHLNCDRAFT_133227 [Chlorella variabilis]|eukprot:XP_005851790.1 hypothetical protein CHLNCDRAFT_133227 [Chlorella variabilis]